MDILSEVRVEAAKLRVDQKLLNRNGVLELFFQTMHGIPMVLACGEYQEEYKEGIHHFHYNPLTESIDEIKFLDKQKIVYGKRDTNITNPKIFVYYENGQTLFFSLFEKGINTKGEIKSEELGKNLENILDEIKAGIYMIQPNYFDVVQRLQKREDYVAKLLNDHIEITEIEPISNILPKEVEEYSTTKI